MTTHDQPTAAPRFEVDQTLEGVSIRIRPRHRIGPFIFLPLWLVLWTAAGIFSMVSIPADDLSVYTEIFMGFWAVGLAATAVAFAWLIAGRETIRVVNGDLEVVHAGLRVSHRWLYEGAKVRDLKLFERPDWVPRVTGSIPLTRPNRTGAIRFDYEARTIYLAPGLDDADGALLAEQLAKHLPRSVRS